MTKPLQEMTVEELRSYAYLAGEVNKDLGHAHPLRWLARQAFDELARRLAELRGAIEPGECPCECCADHDGTYWSECYCGNSDDERTAAVWCTLTNMKRKYKEGK